jgi:hypothetical protein
MPSSSLASIEEHAPYQQHLAIPEDRLSSSNRYHAQLDSHRSSSGCEERNAGPFDEGRMLPSRCAALARESILTTSGERSRLRTARRRGVAFL